MNFLKYFGISLALGAIAVAVKVFIRYVNKFFEDLSKSVPTRLKLNWKDELLFCLVFSVFFLIIFFFIETHAASSHFLAFINLFFLLFLLNSYNFFLRPYIRSAIDRNHIPSPVLEKWVNDQFSTNVRLRRIDDNMVNAYSVGVLPFTKTILLGQPILQKMNSKEIKCIILHELGHLKNNHILILFLTAVFNSLTWSYVFVYLLPIINIFENDGANVALLGGFMGGFQFLVMGLVQRILEYKADLYSASHVGKEFYIGALNKLNKLTGEKLEKDSIHHPSLEKRIESVKDYFK